MLRRNKVYTYGVFDLLHYGHIRSLKQAKKLGKHLTVGVFTDEVVERFKRKPILTQEERMANIKELGIADKVVLQKTFIPRDRKGIICKGEGAGWTTEPMKFKKAKSVLLKYTKGISTSEIIKRIKC